MRLIIYLLAMLTGFSAANAAQPVSPAPSAVVQGVVVAISAQQDQQANTARFQADRTLADLIQISSSFHVAFDNAILPAPVERSDRARE